jgi:hypothetical protein
VDGHLYIGAPVLGNLEGAPFRGPRKIFRSVSVDGHLYIGAPVLGKLEEGLSTGSLRVKRRALF